MQRVTQQSYGLAALPSSGTADPCLDRITRLAAQFFSCPIAVVSLVGPDWVALPSHYGIACEGVRRDGWFCARTVLGREPMVVSDAARDSDFADLPMVRGEPGIRFYAGAPLILRDSSAVGTLAVMDTRPRQTPRPEELQALRDFAALVADDLDRRGALDAGRHDLPGAYLASLAGALPAVVWVTDTAGHCTLFNRFEWDDAEAHQPHGQSHDWLRIVQPEESEFDGKIDLTFECRVPGPDGEDRWILEQARPRFHADGSFAGYIGLCLDITDRKRTEDALRETQEWLSLAQSATGIGFWDWDIVNDSTKCTDQCFRLCGREPRAGLRYADWMQFTHPNDRLSKEDFHARVDQLGGDLFKSEFRCVWPDGSVHWLFGRARIYRDEAGRPVRALGANIDISGYKAAEQRRKEAEKELIASREQLRQLAAHVENTREQERIRISREIHDELGQILTVLKMDLEAVDARYRTSAPRPLPDITRRVASMLKNLEEMIATVRRISTELRPGILDHLGIAAAIEWQLQQTESRTGIRCRAVGLPEPLPLDAHQSTAVFRIFQEMLTNVVRHAGATSIKVEVRVEAAGMLLRVTDDGKGFDPARLADPKSLGLLGMRERALLAGGSLEIESEPGQGATVTLRIPLSAPAPVVPEAAL